MLDQYSETLKKLESVLSRIATRMEIAVNRGLDVITIKTAIIEANMAIDNARNAIQVQITQIYTVDVKTEDTLKADVRVTHEIFKADIEKVKIAVQAAHDVVHKAAVFLGQLEGINLGWATSTEPVACPIFGPVSPEIDAACKEKGGVFRTRIDERGCASPRFCVFPTSTATSTQ
jgi:hypothetical protein